MWPASRNPKPSHRSRYYSLIVEQLEGRVLLSRSPLPAPSQAPSPLSQYMAEAASLAAPLAEMPSAANVPAESWAAAPQRPDFFGSLHKAAVASKGPLVSIPFVIGPHQSSTPAGE